jgi:hypothetical protein
VGQHLLQHLQQNLSQIEEIFAEFQTPKSNYHLFAGFNENLVEEIHILVHTKFPDTLLSRLAPILPVHHLQSSVAAAFLYLKE